MPEDDLIPLISPIELVFESLALLAGTLEAERALKRSKSVNHQPAQRERHEKKANDRLVVWNVNTISASVNACTESEQ